MLRSLVSPVGMPNHQLWRFLYTANLSAQTTGPSFFRSRSPWIWTLPRFRSGCDPEAVGWGTEGLWWLGEAGVDDKNEAEDKNTAVGVENGEDKEAEVDSIPWGGCSTRR